MVPPRLAQLQQQDYSAGIVRSVARFLIPDSGVFDAVNCLLDDTGSLYRRGGSAYYSTANFGSTGLNFLWNGYLSGQERTLFADGSNFGTLDGALAPVTLGNGGLGQPYKAVALGDILFVNGKMWGGSRKLADYSTGTVSTTQNSAIVTGSGTTWNTLVDAGMLFRIGTERAYVVKSIDSTTQITLNEPYTGSTGAGKSYALRVMDSASSPYRPSSLYAVAGNKLFSLEGNVIWESAGRTDTGLPQPHSFPANNNLTLPQGVQITGGEGLGGNLFAFSTGGVYVVSNVALDLIDAVGNQQQRVDRISADLILWSNEGVATWQNSLVVPCLDGVWLLQSAGAPRLLSRSITPLYVSYVRAGYRTGLATTYKSTYFLPILDGANNVQDVLVCRLDRPVRTGLGETWPWTRLADSGATVSAVTTRVGLTSRAPELLAASRKTTGRVTKLSGFFEPAAGIKNDADGTTHSWKVITKDYPTGNGNANLVRRFRIRRELVDAAADQPTIQAYYSIGIIQAGLALWDSGLWDTAVWADSSTAEDVALPGVAPEDDGRTPYAWPVNVRTRYIRFRLQSSSPSSKLVLRSSELFVRPSGKA